METIIGAITERAEVKERERESWRKDVDYSQKHSQRQARKQEEGKEGLKVG